MVREGQTGAVTVIVSVAFTVPQPPVRGISYAKLPVAVGVPEIVITLADQTAVTPAGNPVAVPIPVAPVVAIVIGVNGVPTTSVGFDDGVPTVLVMMQPQVGVPVEDIMIDWPVAPGGRLTQ